MKNIAVISGGYSSEVIVSVKSAKTVFNHIDKSKYNCFEISITKDSWYVLINDAKIDIDISDFSFIHNGAKINFDCAYIVIHGTPGEDGKLQAYFDMIDIPYTTCNHLASTITFNKYTCNQLAKTLDVKCAKSLMLRKNEKFNVTKIGEELGFPMFVKPNDGGSSFGISKVKKEEGIRKAIKEAFAEGEEVIIESFLSGIEVTCGVYMEKGTIKALPITEIVSDNEFFDFEAKYNGSSQEITPARISDELTNKIQRQTESIYAKMNLAGICRIDYIIMENEPYMIEINTVPGMSDASLIPQQANCAGIELKDLLGIQIEEALA